MATKRKHVDALNQCARERWTKMAAVGIDPYEVEKENMSDDMDKLPPISYYDIVNYLVNNMEELHLKSMDTYNQCLNAF